MNSQASTAQASRPEPVEAEETAAHSPPPATLLEALMTLIEARIGLIHLESADAAKAAARRLASFAIACFCLIFAWILLLAASTQIIAEAGQWPWSWVAIAMAILHLIIGIFFARQPQGSQNLFSATRAEFKKDREWIVKLTKKRSST